LELLDQEDLREKRENVDLLESLDPLVLLDHLVSLLDMMLLPSLLCLAKEHLRDLIH